MLNGLLQWKACPWAAFGSHLTERTDFVSQANLCMHYMVRRELLPMRIELFAVVLSMLSVVQAQSNGTASFSVTGGSGRTTQEATI